MDKVTVAPVLSLGTRSDKRDGQYCDDEAANGSGPPGKTHQIDGHLEREEDSHEEEARAQKAYLGEGAPVQLCIEKIGGIPGGSGGVFAGNNALGVKFNPATGNRYSNAKNNKYPVEESHGS